MNRVLKIMGWILAVMMFVFATVQFAICAQPSDADAEEFRKTTSAVSTAPTALTESEGKSEENKMSPYIFEEIPFDPPLQEMVWEACEESGCPYELALAVIWKETGFSNDVGDGGDSVGYMQIQPQWHYDRMALLGVSDLSDPLSNFRVGCNFIEELIELYGNETDALTYYNSGSPGYSEYADEVLQFRDYLVDVELWENN